MLGPSNSNWFEDATRRKLQQIIVPRSFDSVIDSPFLTPRISQICTQELSGKLLFLNMLLVSVFCKQFRPRKLLYFKGMIKNIVICLR